MGHLHRSTKGEIRRLAQLLNAELERPDPEGLTADDVRGGRAPTPGSRHRTERHWQRHGPRGHAPE